VGKSEERDKLEYPGEEEMLTWNARSGLDLAG